MSAASALARRLRHAVDAYLLSGTARSVRSDRLTYLSQRKLRRLEAALRDVLRRNVPGDVAEFGLALGGSGIVLATIAKAGGRSFHGFDVFGMIPAPTSDKDDEKSKARYRTIANGESKGLGGDVYYGYRDNLYEEVCGSFRKYGLDVGGPSVSLHKGLFENTLPAAPTERIAFAHIDCDWYEPVAYCLHNVAARLSPRGVIVLDDYHDYGGCRTATDEFLRMRPDFIFEDGENVILRHAGSNA
jgi:asparagine synthase (glutamine-hydrolysing)